MEACCLGSDELPRHRDDRPDADLLRQRPAADAGPAPGWTSTGCSRRAADAAPGGGPDGVRPELPGLLLPGLPGLLLPELPGLLLPGLVPPGLPGLLPPALLLPGPRALRPPPGLPEPRVRPGRA